MEKIVINNKIYTLTNYYISFRRAWVEDLDEDTQKLVLDFTILWNMFEHQAFDNRFKRNEKLDECIRKIIRKTNQNDIIHVNSLFKEYIKKYKSIKEFYESFSFRNSNISLTMIEKLHKSEEVEDKIRLLIYSCYRVRCNLFHGPKCVFNLDNQKLLFLSMNELLSLIGKCYGH